MYIGNNFMVNDLIAFANGIKNNTGINLSVFDIDGNVLVGGENLENAPVDFKGVHSDADKNATYFRFVFNTKEYIASIPGVGQQQNSYAFLITQLASSFKIDITKEQFVKNLLAGEIETQSIKKHAKKFSIVDKPSFVLLINLVAGEKTDLIDFLESYKETEDFVSLTDDERVVLVKVCDSMVADYFSATQYAEFLTRSVFEETGAQIKIGIGGIVDGLEKLHLSYAQALSTVDMMDVLQSSGDVHTYKEYLLIKILGDLPKNKINSYLSLLLDVGAKDVLEDQEIIQTAEAFLDNNLSISETSRQMFLHRNTLSYRLDKIEKATGLNIRKFSDAVTFRLISILLKLTR